MSETAQRTRESRQDHEERLAREADERQRQADEQRQARRAGLREAARKKEIGATSGEHSDLEAAVLAAQERALEAKQVASSRAFPSPANWNERVEQLFRQCEAAREAAIEACQEYLIQGEALLVAAEPERIAAVKDARAYEARQREEQAAASTRYEEALSGGCAEVLGDLNSQLSAYPALLASAELQLAEKELALERCRVPIRQARLWVLQEENLLREERKRYELSRHWKDGEEAKIAEGEWSALLSRISGLEARATAARRELEAVSSGARQKAQRVSAMATAGRR
jgi:hypothetical protein